MSPVPKNDRIQSSSTHSTLKMPVKKFEKGDVVEKIYISIYIYVYASVYENIMYGPSTSPFHLNYADELSKNETAAVHILILY